MKKIPLLLLSFLVFACSTDSDEVSEEIENEEVSEEIENEEIENGAPSIVGQSFQVDEHSMPGTLIGNVEASDNDNDVLTYTIDSEENILINETTGALSIGEGLKLDFESTNSLGFTVSVFDGTAISDATITLNIADINEFDALNEDQKALLAHFKHLTLFQDPTSSTQNAIRKWNQQMRLYLVGNFSTTARNIVQEVIANYNMLTSTGSFSILLVENESESNVQLFLGTKEETAEVFPTMYQQIKNLNVAGYAISSFSGNDYRSAQIWVSSQNNALVTHELGHALGMGHSNLCNGANASAMCSTISPNNQLLPIEQNVISLFYNEAIPSGLNEQQIEDQVSNLILLQD